MFKVITLQIEQIPSAQTISSPPGEGGPPILRLLFLSSSESMDLNLIPEVGDANVVRSPFDVPDMLIVDKAVAFPIFPNFVFLKTRQAMIFMRAMFGTVNMVRYTGGTPGT